MTGLHPALPRGPVYAVGDIHGRADLLATMLELIRADRDTDGDDMPAPVIFLGDYIDRGPQSRQVIDMLLAFGEEAGFAPCFLMGNHEAAMLAYLDGRSTGAAWGRHGADATLHAYGVPPPPAGSRSAWQAARATFAAAVPARHRTFLEQLQLTAQIGPLLFVHAGIRPGVPTDRQEHEDLLSIRSAFLDATLDPAMLVVHGHTPQPQPYGAPGRLCLDSGAYMTGRLSGAVFHHDRIEIIEASARGGRRYPWSGASPATDPAGSAT